MPVIQTDTKDYQSNCFGQFDLVNLIVNIALTITAEITGQKGKV